MTRLGERAYDLAADEAGAAEHRDQTLHLHSSSHAMTLAITGELDDWETFAMKSQLSDFVC
jgi:hypothetical protein